MPLETEFSGMPEAIVIGVETWASFWPEAEPLVWLHREETAPNDPRPFEPQPELCQKYFEAGVLGIVGARVAGSLVGYSMWYLSPQIDAKGLAATQGPWYIIPQHRQSSAGFRLFEEGLRMARAAGARVAFVHHWLVGDGPKLEAYFLRKGAIPIEHTFLLQLED